MTPSTKTQKRPHLLPAVFCALVGIFVVLASYIAIPSNPSVKRTFFPFVAVLAILFFILGAVLTLLTLKSKIEKKLRVFLLLTGASAASFLPSVILHNFFYALGVITSHIAVLSYLMEVFHVVFFLIGVVVCPLGFLVGVVGSVVVTIRKRR